MNLERPSLQAQGSLEQRVSALERYLYRLVQDLEEILEQLEEGGQDDEL